MEYLTFYKILCMHTQKQADGFREILKKFLMCVLSSIYLFSNLWCAHNLHRYA